MNSVNWLNWVHAQPWESVNNSFVDSFSIPILVLISDKLLKTAKEWESRFLRNQNRPSSRLHHHHCPTIQKLQVPPFPLPLCPSLSLSLPMPYLPVPLWKRGHGNERTTIHTTVLFRQAVMMRYFEHCTLDGYHPLNIIFWIEGHFESQWCLVSCLNYPKSALENLVNEECDEDTGLIGFCDYQILWLIDDCFANSRFKMGMTVLIGLCYLLVFMTIWSFPFGSHKIW